MTRDNFTQRREGAKKSYGSKCSISSQNVSGLAALREIPVTQERQEFFTQRRKGAKRRNQSEYWRLFRHAVGDTLNTVFDQVVAKVDQEAQSFVHEAQIRQDLFAVHSIECRDRFYFHNYAVVDDQVGAKAFVEHDPVPGNRYGYLPFHKVTVFAQFMRQRDFIHDFKDARSKCGVQVVGDFDNASRDFILFHTGKPALLSSPCEAKNISARAEGFMPEREDAKKRSEAKRQISSHDRSGLAALREISATEKQSWQR
jgi:hypothetical protein